MISESNSGLPVLAAISLGDGVAQACRQSDTSAVVVGSFSYGFYLRAADLLIAVGSPRISAGPLHLVLETSPPPQLSASRVRLSATRLESDSCTIELTSAARYRSIPPSAGTLIEIAPVLARLNDPPEDLAHVWSAVVSTVERADLWSAMQLLAGLGKGLTPTGDDVLAGLLLFANWADPGSLVPTEIALAAETTDLSRCYLSWAARGQCIQPVHDLIEAASEIMSEDHSLAVSVNVEHFARCVEAVASIGGSSGKGMLAGLGLAASALPFSNERVIGGSSDKSRPVWPDGSTSSGRSSRSASTGLAKTSVDKLAKPNLQ